MEKHKSKSAPTTSSDGNTEVFVLTPEVLAKLGISIQNSVIQSPVKNPVAAVNQNLSLNGIDSPHKEKGESSIIETASLMKESVFLSPTFQEANLNIISGVSEQTDSNEAAKTNNSISDNNDNKHSPYAENDLKESTHLSRDKHNESNNHIPIEPVNDFMSSHEFVKECKIVNQEIEFGLTETSQRNNPDTELYKGKLDFTVPNPNIRDVSDNSYKNSDNALKMNHTHEKCDSSNKVKILSEQVIVNISELKEITKLRCSTDGALIPITVDTLVIGKPFHSQSNSVTNEYVTLARPFNSLDRQHVTADCLIDNSSIMKSQQIIKLSSENTIKSQPIDTIAAQGLESPETENLSTLPRHIEKGKIKFQNNNFIMSELKQHDTELSNEKLVESKGSKTCNGDVNHIENIITVKLGEKLEDNKKNAGKNNGINEKLISKIAGEDNEILSQIENDEINILSNISKTYQRTVTPKFNPKVNQISHVECSDDFQISQDTYLNRQIFGKGSKSFCLCHDFGNLAHYDCESLYDHIHFTKKNNFNDDLKVLFSIYDDNYVAPKDLITDYTDENEVCTNCDENQDKTYIPGICWNCVVLEKEDADESIIFSKHITTSENTLNVSQNSKYVDSNNKVVEQRGNHIESIITSTTIPVIPQKKFVELKNKISSLETGVVPKKKKKSMDSITLHSKKVNVGHNLEYNVVVEKLKGSTEMTKSTKRVMKIDCEISPKKIKLETTNASTPIEQSKNTLTTNESIASSIKKVLRNSIGIADLCPSSSETLETGTENQDLKKKSETANNDTIDASQFPVLMIETSLKNSKSSVTSESSSQIADNVSDILKDSTVVEIEVQLACKVFKCGVCNKDVNDSQWFDHSCKEHHYLAWRQGEPELDLQDEGQIRGHLQNIIKQIGGLVCPNCGLLRKIPKKYRNHVKTCGVNESMDVSTSSMELDSSREVNETTTTSRLRNSRVSNVKVPTVTCGVCADTIPEPDWNEHIKIKHNYLAWKDGENPIDLNCEEDVKEHLSNIARQGRLTCYECGGTWRYVKKFLLHQQICLRNNTVHTEYECAVCDEKGDMQEWANHAMRRHYNIAWKKGCKPINIKDFQKVDKYLKAYKIKFGELVCKKCKTSKTSTRSFYAHILTCGKTEQEIEAFQNVCKICNGKYLCIYQAEHDSTHSTGNVNSAAGSVSEVEEQTNEKARPGRRKKSKLSWGAVNEEDKIDLSKILKCGVCKIEVVEKDWINHIQKAHAYLAWIDGEESLDVNDPDKVRNHLTMILNTKGVLVCNICGVSRRYERGYTQHMRACSASGYKPDDASQPTDLNPDEYECAVCKERGWRRDFRKHAMDQHYNIAWMTGEKPINLRNPYAVEKYLKQYKDKDHLVCKICKVSRASYYGFYAHILQCGKSEKELEEVHNVCDICNQKYLCIYRNQHLAMHKYQVNKNEEKAIKEAQIHEEQKGEEIPSGKRKAAVKAKEVIKTHTVHVHVDADGNNVCSCGITFDNAEDMSNHRCRRDSDVSVKMEPHSEESEESDVDYVSDEDEIIKSSPKTHKPSAEGINRIKWMNYKIDNYIAHLTQGFKDFVTVHYSSKSLFNKWRNRDLPLVPPNDIPTYLPTLTESCKMKFGIREWMTYKRFESIRSTGFFTGGAVQCVSWAPSIVNSTSDEHYLAVVSHRGPDVPRSTPTDRLTGHALIQLWHCGYFKQPPELSLALALDFGVVWAMDWCPSGARDPSPSTQNAASRLGLLAIACSNGSAYILAVPYPPASTELEQIVYKLKPRAELRFSMTAERKTYQATSINWSHQKGHSIVLVGYSDGSTALFDLKTESPLLKTDENHLIIFYPFQDRLSESSTITGAVLTPTMSSTSPCGAVCTAAVTGGSMRGGAVSARSSLPAASALAAPHWPALLLYSDAAFTTNTITELDWWGGGRRVGAARAGAACLRCGRTAALSSPLVRLQRAHPVYPEVYKQAVATLLMVPLEKKASRKPANDDLSVVVEPLSYDEAISKYGLEFSLVSKKEQSLAQKLSHEHEITPHRFPLSELVAAAFCPSQRFHEKLALATHAGFVFLIQT